MKISYKYDSKTIWKINRQYLIERQLNSIVLVALLLFIGIIHVLFGKVDWFGWFAIGASLFWFIKWILDIKKQIKLTSELQNKDVNLEFNETEIITRTDNTEIKRKWENFKEAIVMKDYTLLVLRGVYQHVFIPRQNKDIEKHILGRIPKAKRKFPWLSVSVLVIIIAIILFRQFFRTQVHSDEYEIAKKATNEMQNIINYRYGINIQIHPGFQKTLGKPLRKNIGIIFHSDSVKTLDDTLKTEYKILYVIDSLINFNPELYVFEYERQITKNRSESNFRKYKPEQVKKIVKDMKNTAPLKEE